MIGHVTWGYYEHRHDERICVVKTAKIATRVPEFTVWEIRALIETCNKRGV